MSRRIEVCGVQQTYLENVYHSKIHEINDQLKTMNAKYNDWDNVDERIKSRYTKEEYKSYFIDRKREERSVYVQKLHTVRNGYVIE